MSTVDMPLTSGKSFVSFKCIEIKQPIGCFYIGSVEYKDLIDITYSDVRRINGEREFESYLGIQRPLDKKRSKKIADYTNTVDASFPTSVILSIPSSCASYDEKTGVMTLSAFEGDGEYDEVTYENIAKVLDGQHRIEGLKGYQGDSFDINVSIFIDLDVASEGYIFSTVNLAQTKVNKSLVYDLYDLAKARSPQKLCHNIAVVLTSREDSPFYGRIKRLGTAENPSGKMGITQAAFVQALMKHISREEIKDRDIYKRGKIPLLDKADLDKLIFRSFMIDDRDYELVDIIWNYFSAIRQRWPKAWDSAEQGYMLSKTNGFMACMRFIKDIYLNRGRLGEVISEEEFLAIFSQFDIDDEEFTVDNYKPGSSGEGALYRRFKDCAGY
ncbi:DGQHR domain-containing protein [Oceanospirillum beijerinckii]|uniref:DGQHR domain-containing protein n=1 Tax=Oceanospirillum beijerinckii TaxID=64976 RepID=UPI00041B61AF|nr:DGQHR domain-containing protein [Oceanospirillum beijerinckii]